MGRTPATKSLMKCGQKDSEELNMKKKWDFAQYKKALDGASPTVKEALLQRADQVDHLPMEEILALVKLAYPDRDIC